MSWARPKSPIEIETDMVRFRADARSRGLVPFELRHRPTCQRDAGHIVCHPWTGEQQIHWRNVEYLVAIPHCRDNYMRRIINAVEEFGVEVGWYQEFSSCGSWRTWRTGIHNTKDNHMLVRREWFPMMPLEEWWALNDYACRQCQPAASASYWAYYWVRDIARVVQAQARARGRLRCLWCRKIYPWKFYDKWLERTKWGEEYYRDVLCDAVCQREYERAKQRAERCERRELEWLKKGRQTLVETRRLLRSPSDLDKLRQRPPAV